MRRTLSARNATDCFLNPIAMQFAAEFRDVQKRQGPISRVLATCTIHNVPFNAMNVFGAL